MKILHKYFWRELYWSVKNYFWPQTKWLTKHVPKGWIDKDALLENILAATIVEFVEGERGLKVTVWDDTPERLDVYHKLNSAYHWFKWQRQALEDKENKSLSLSLVYPDRCWADLRSELYYDFTTKKELLDNLHLGNIIKYRKHLWT